MNKEEMIEKEHCLPGTNLLLDQDPNKSCLDRTIG